MPNYINHEGIFLNGIKIMAGVEKPPDSMDAAVGSQFLDTVAGVIYIKAKSGRWSASTSSPDVVMIRDFSVKADGTDETTKLQNAVNGTPEMGTLLLTGLDAAIRTNSPVDLIERRNYVGQWSTRWIYRFTSPYIASVKALSDFTGDSIFRIRDKAITSRTNDNDGINVSNIVLDGSAASTANLDLWRVEGRCRTLKFENVVGAFAQGTGRCFHFLTGAGSAAPRGITMLSPTAYRSDLYGFRMNGVTDAHIDNLLAVVCLDHGVYWSNSGENEIRGRSVFNEGDGWFFDGTTTSGMTTLYPATDRNSKNGVRITQSGHQPMQLVSPRLRRDGRLSASANYAAIQITGSAGFKTVPVDIVIPQVVPGQNDPDDALGAGIVSPQFALRATYAQRVTVHGGQLQGVSGGFSDGGNNDQVEWTPQTVWQTGGIGAGVRNWPTPIGQSFYDLLEQADPAAPSANIGRLFARDNGSGKTQVCVRFPTGAVQVLATEP